MSMHYYKATIQYKGTNYAGFQWQNGLQTVQNEFNQALAKISEGKITTMAASRTDTGVHAYVQVVKITSEFQLNLGAKTLNQFLPEDIRCLTIASCPGSFKPSSQTTSKEYRYLFTNTTQVLENERQLVANIANPLDIHSMNKCVEILKGTHDFCNFYSSGSNVKSTIRNIISIELNEINPHSLFSDSSLFQLPPELHLCYQLRIEANGFLKQMIRHLVSALWMVGSGKISVEDFSTLLTTAKSSKQLWKVAPPNGLYLYRINYS